MANEDVEVVINTNKPKIDWEAIARDLLSLAETLEDFGVHKSLRDRLKQECELSEEQLDKLGV